MCAQSRWGTAESVESIGDVVLVGVRVCLCHHYHWYLFVFPFVVDKSCKRHLGSLSISLSLPLSQTTTAITTSTSSLLAPNSHRSILI